MHGVLIVKVDLPILTSAQNLDFLIKNYHSAFGLGTALALIMLDLIWHLTFRTTDSCVGVSQLKSKVGNPGGGKCQNSDLPFQVRYIKIPGKHFRSTTRDKLRDVGLDMGSKLKCHKVIQLHSLLLLLRSSSLLKRIQRVKIFLNLFKILLLSLERKVRINSTLYCSREHWRFQSR